MPKYRVFFVSTASAYAEVEADNKDAAEEEAYYNLRATLCHQCAHDVELSGDWDIDTVEEIED